MRRAKIVILMTIILIGGIVLFSLWQNLGKKRESGQEAEIPKVADDDTKMHFEKVQFVEDKQGRRTWELEAKSVRQYEDQDLVLLEDVKVTVFTKEGRCRCFADNRGRPRGTNTWRLAGSTFPSRSHRSTCVWSERG